MDLTFVLNNKKTIIFVVEFLRRAKLGKEKTESKFINVAIWQPQYGFLLRPACLSVWLSRGITRQLVADKDN
jgi:hypothetical protein